MTNIEALELIPFVRYSYNTKNFTKDSYTAQQWFGTVENVLKQKADRRGNWEHYEHREPQYDIDGNKTWAEAYKCSNCGFIHTVIEDFGHYSFCPRCGADMRGE